MALAKGPSIFKDADGVEHLFVPYADFPCSFCGKDMQAGYVDGTKEALIHEEPKCPTFVDLPIEDFLEQNNRRLGITKPTGNLSN